MLNISRRVQSAVLNNGYPNGLVEEYFCHYTPQKLCKRITVPQKVVWMQLPFMCDDTMGMLTSRINKMVQALFWFVRVAVRGLTARSFYARNKDAIPEILISSVVYRFDCECSASKGPHRAAYSQMAA